MRIATVRRGRATRRSPALKSHCSSAARLKPHAGKRETFPGRQCTIRTHAEAKGFHRRFHFSRAGARRAVAGVGWSMFHLSHTVDYFGIGLTVYKFARSGKLYIPQTAVRHYCAVTAPFRSLCALILPNRANAVEQREMRSPRHAADCEWWWLTSEPSEKTSDIVRFLAVEQVTRQERQTMSSAACTIASGRSGSPC